MYKKCINNGAWHNTHSERQTGGNTEGGRKAPGQDGINDLGTETATTWDDDKGKVFVVMRLARRKMIELFKERNGGGQSKPGLYRRPSSTKTRANKNYDVLSLFLLYPPHTKGARAAALKFKAKAGNKNRKRPLGNSEGALHTGVKREEEKH